MSYEDERDPDRQWDERGEREIERLETPWYEDPNPDDVGE